jgi:hypothetical protein
VIIINKYKFPFWYLAVIAGFIILMRGNVYAQQEDKLISILDAPDIKKLEKADKYRNDGDRLIEAANQLYMETFAVQQNYELDDKAKKKKVKQLEEQARQKITEASSLYQKGNEIRYALYKTYIEKFWSKFEGDESAYVNAKLIEEQSNDLYYQALTGREEAGRMPDGDEKIQKLNSASESENQAIDKQRTALGLYYNIDLSGTSEERISPAETYNPPVTEQAEISQPAENIQHPENTLPEEVNQPQENIQPSENIQPPGIEEQAVYNEPAAVPPAGSIESVPAQPAVTTVPGQVAVNPEMIAMYNRYVVSQGRPEDSVSTTGFTSLTSFDTHRILELWYAYIYGSAIEGFEEKPPENIAQAESDMVQTEQMNHQEPPSEEQIAVVENERQARQIPADENVIYRVQIAANKTELDQRALQKIYYGNKNVEMIEENGWCKYSIGDFSSFGEADKFRKTSGARNAFIVAYRKGKRFVPAVAEETETITPATGFADLPGGLLFRIQVAAGRAPMTKEQIEKIYPGHYSVEMVEEEGWYKYQLMGVRLYSDALFILKDIPTRGAFISAYESGTKINLFQGVMKNRNLEKSVKVYGRKNLFETEFHVQLAASRFPIKKEDLARIYSGTEPVCLIIEEGWYKYHIKTGNSYEQAQKIKSECGVNKAFIAAYKRARKIPLPDAIYDRNP